MPNRGQAALTTTILECVHSCVRKSLKEGAIKNGMQHQGSLQGGP
jgi:hypothetical protein